MSMFDDVRTCAALRDLATELKLDGGALVTRWRKHVAQLIAEGKTSSQASNLAYRTLVDRVRLDARAPVPKGKSKRS